MSYLTNPNVGGFRLRCVRCGLAGQRLYQDFDGALRFIARIVEQNRKLERPECEKK